MVENNLLNITTVPIKVEINVTSGSFRNPRVNNPDASFKMDIKTEDGQLQISSEPMKIHIDTYAARSSMGYGNYTDADLFKRKANEAINLAYEGTARIVQDGNQLARGASPSDIAAQHSRAGQTIQTIMDFIPKEGADVTFEDGVLNINYEVGDTEIDWQNAQMMPFEFTPGRVEISIAQMPRVEIEYVGSPIYVPPSAAPDYEPTLDTRG